MKCSHTFCSVEKIPYMYKNQATKSEFLDCTCRLYILFFAVISKRSVLLKDPVTIVKNPFYSHTAVYANSIKITRFRSFPNFLYTQTMSEFPLHSDHVLRHTGRRHSLDFLRLLRDCAWAAPIQYAAIAN